MEPWPKFVQTIFTEFHSSCLEGVIGDAKFAEQMESALRNHIFDMDGPKSLVGNFSEKQKFLGKIFRAVIEIEQAKNALVDISIYIRSFPYKSKKLSRSRYLRYHVENYYNEIYLLKERIKAFANILKKAYRKEKAGVAVEGVISALLTHLNETLKSVIEVRGSHVHQYRFSTEDIDRLELLDLLVVQSGDSEFQNLSGYYDAVYCEIRDRWRERMESNNGEFRKILDRVGKVSSLICFDEESGKFRYPAHLR